MKILAHDMYQDPAWENESCRYIDLDTLYAQSDVIFLHCPLFAENRHMICRASIEKMKDGVLLINNSRGGLVVDNPLLSAKNCVITPHISWAALECRRRLQQTAIENVRAYLAGACINVVC